MTGHIYRLSVPEEKSLILIAYSDFKERVHSTALYDTLHKLSLDKFPELT
jgi:hypothetical protein